MGTETRPDYAGHARKGIGEMEEKRGLVAAELAEIKAEPQDGARLRDCSRAGGGR